MKKRKREILKRVFFSQEELNIISKKMEIIGTDNFSAYVRKMTIDGMIINQDFSNIKQLIFEINRIGNNINQIAKNVNINNSANINELKSVNKKMEEIWHILKSEISKQL